MAISIKTISCPQCGANVKCEDGREKLFCSYCGALIVVTNENEHIYRHIDEADVKRAENERIEMLANMRANEEKNKASSYSKKVRLIVILTLLALGIILMIIGAIDNPMLAMVGMLVLEAAGFVGLSMIPKRNNRGTTQNVNNQTTNKQTSNTQNSIRITSAMANYYSCNYESIATIMKSSGFTNVTCVPLKDMGGRTSIASRNGQVSTLSINGEEDIREDDYYPADAVIIIAYHSFSTESLTNVETTSSDQTKTSTGTNGNAYRQQANQPENAICPSCGAEVQVDSSGSFAFCPFCGTKNNAVLSHENDYQHINCAATTNKSANKTIVSNLIISFSTTDPRVGMVTRIVSTGEKYTYVNGTTLSFCLPQGHQPIVLKIGKINYNRDIVIPPSNNPVKIYASYNGRAQITIDQPAY